MVSFSEKTTPDYAGKSKKNYIVKRPSGIMEVRSTNCTINISHFWARGYFVDTVGRNKKQVQEYIKRQLEEDQVADQMSLKEFIDPLRVARIPRHK